MLCLYPIGPRYHRPLSKFSQLVNTSLCMTLKELLTYATLKVNFPLVSCNVCSCLPVSTSNIEIFPALLPEMTCFPSGEKSSVHTSVGPVSIVFSFSPDAMSQRIKVESWELLAKAGIEREF